MEAQPNISFDNTAYAFEYKSDKELKKARFLFSCMGKPLLVKLGTTLTPWAVKVGLPVKGIIRATIFDQFVGGETLEETAKVAQKLGEYKVDIILDYGVEGGNDGEAGYDHATEEFIRVINYAATQPNIPFMSIKVTGLARFALLELLDEKMKQGSGTLMEKYNAAVTTLTADERIEWERVIGRLAKIFAVAADKKTGVLVDAEETWIQDPVDAITMHFMGTYNKTTAIIFNTIQLYRHDRLDFLKESHKMALSGGFILGAKNVRGAYMEKERKRAEEKGYPSPIQPDKAATDRDYNEGLQYAIDNLDTISLLVASHNEDSNLLATRLLEKKGFAPNHPHIHFSQLYGMSDNITFNLAHAGCKVSKYLPFGPIKDVIPYLMRRAQENTSVKGQTGRELLLINKELKRRNA